MNIQVGIITVSDRASRGQYDDLGGPALKKPARATAGPYWPESLVPNEKRDIQRALRELINKGCSLILTTGGTGVACAKSRRKRFVKWRCGKLPGFAK